MFINKKTYELTEEWTKNSFPVDRSISLEVRDLNMKGYKTVSSYGGGNKGTVTVPYIVFSRAYDDLTPPLGWKVDTLVQDDRFRTIIEADLESIENIGYQEIINNLKNWVKLLTKEK